PALAGDALAGQLLRSPLRGRLERLRAHEVDPLRLAAPARHVGEPVVARPGARPELEVAQAALLGQLADDRLLRCLAGLDAAAGRRPHGLVRPLEADEEDALGRVDDERARRRPER